MRPSAASVRGLHGIHTYLRQRELRLYIHTCDRANCTSIHTYLRQHTYLYTHPSATARTAPLYTHLRQRELRLYTHLSATAHLSVYTPICDSANCASATPARAAERMCLQAREVRQYLYFCTSKASKLNTQVNGREDVPARACARRVVVCALLLMLRCVSICAFVLVK